MTIKKQSRAWNLAILTTEKKATALPIGETNDLETGDAVLVVSSAQDGSPAGKINRVGGKRTDGGTLRYSLDEQIAPGASGAPVFDTDGRLTGIATFLLRGSRFDSLVTPVSALKALLPSIRPVKARVAATTRRGSSEKDLKNDVTLAKYEKNTPLIKRNTNAPKQDQKKYWKYKISSHLQRSQGPDNSIAPTYA